MKGEFNGKRNECHEMNVLNTHNICKICTQYTISNCISLKCNKQNKCNMQDAQNEVTFYISSLFIPWEGTYLQQYP